MQYAPPGVQRRVDWKFWNLVAALCLLAVGAYFVLHRPAAQSVDEIPAPPGPYVLDPQIRDAGAIVGLTPDVLTKLKVQFDTPWPGGPEAVGIYLSSARTIIIDPAYRQRDTQELAGVIAYEYMHDVWSHASHPAGLESWMDEVAYTYPAVQQHLTDTLQVDGSSAPELRYTELLSITCTQTADSHMNPQLVEYCDEELPGRRNLPPWNFIY